MKTKLLIILILFMSQKNFGQKLPLLEISEDGNYIVTQANKPFFWLGGTAWEMIHRLDKAEIDKYLNDRAEKGFTVIQTVILAELDGLDTPNAYGEKPLFNNDPTRINEKYFELVDYTINKANELGLYIALLPTWGDKFNKAWGVGPEIFTEQNAELFGELLAERYLSANNLVWVLGGDRIPEKESHFAIIKAMAKGIKKVDSKHLMTYHPSGSKKITDYFNEDWLDLAMFQSGHSRKAKEYDFVLDARKSAVKRPVINAESRYENIKDRFWENKDYGWLDAADVRISAYWSLISGAAGYTYGCNDIWQMYDSKRTATLNARTDWTVALDLPGSTQMKYMREIFEVFPWQKMRYDQALIVNDNPENEAYKLAAIGENEDFILAYSPLGNSIEVDLKRINAEKVEAYWFNPRSGKMVEIGNFATTVSHEFAPWSDGWGSDFLLIIVSENASYDFSKFN